MISGFACENGHLQRLTETGSPDALSHAVWIDLQSASPDEIDRVQQATGLNVPSEADVSEIETSSRLASRDGTLYLSMPLIQLAEPWPAQRLRRLRALPGTADHRPLRPQPYLRHLRGSYSARVHVVHMQR